MEPLTERLGLDRFYRSLPGPLVAIVTMAACGVLFLDLLLPDPLFLLDEALLGLLALAGSRELVARVDGRRQGLGQTVRGPSLSHSAPQMVPADPELRQLRSALSTLEAVSARVPGAGSVGARAAVRELERHGESLATRLSEHDAFLARRDNDPWQVSLAVERKEQRAADLEAGGDTSQLAVATRELAALRSHSASVQARVAERAAELLEVRSLTAQLRSLAQELPRGMAGLSGRLGGSGSLDPKIVTLLRSLEASSKADEEVDAVLRVRSHGFVPATH